MVTAQSTDWVMPKRTSFPSMLPPACVALTCWFAPTLLRMGIAGLLGGQGDRDADQEDNGRSCPQHPALTRIAHHLAEHVEQARSEGEDGE